MSRTLVLWTAVVVSASAQTDSRPSFADFERTFRPSPAERTESRPWNWPAPGAFRERFDRYAEDSRALATFEADARLERVDEKLEKSGLGSERVFGIAFHSEDGLVAHVIAPWSGNPSAIEESAMRTRWKVATGRLDPGPAKLVTRDRTLTLTDVRVAKAPPLPHDLWADWVYVAALLDTDPDRDDDPKIPRGQCSHDDGPIRDANRHSLAAERDGRLGRFLRLRLAIMSDSFERRAWSSTGDAEHGTLAFAFERAPIDLERFFVGLMLQTDPKRDRAFDADFQRLARAIAESGQGPVLVPRLRRLAQDPDLDEWNRLRATSILTLVLAHDPAGKPLGFDTSLTRPFEEVAATLRDLRLPAISRRWLGLE